MSEAQTQWDGTSACPTQGAAIAASNAGLPVLRLITYRHNARGQRGGAPGQIHRGVTPI